MTKEQREQVNEALEAIVFDLDIAEERTDSAATGYLIDAVKKLRDVVAVLAAVRS